MALKAAFVILAIAAVAQLVTVSAEPEPEPQPFNLGKFVNNAVNTVKTFAVGSGKCLQNSGVPASLIKKGVACGPSAVMGPEAYAACAGLASINEARKAIGCFSKNG